MYESIGYETYSESEAFKMKVSFLPRNINRGFEPYDYDTPGGYELAKEFKSPLDL
jgi:hypothetical protein